MADDQITIRGPRFRDLTGKQFARLTVLRIVGKSVRGDVLWLCRCECGGEVVGRSGDLNSGNTRSCGCLKRERFLRDCRQTKHGKWKTPEWGVWSGIQARCHNPEHPGYANYGGRGILVCRGWRDSFENFLADMGERPSAKHSVDRIDNERGYDCGHCEDCKGRNAEANCRWATPKEQASNRRSTRRITFNGETMTLTDWATRVGISTPLLHHRLKSGWSVEDALSKPADRSANHRHKR